jgi:hypothetical protein
MTTHTQRKTIRKNLAAAEFELLAPLLNHKTYRYMTGLGEMETLPFDKNARNPNDAKHLKPKNIMPTPNKGRGGCGGMDGGSVALDRIYDRGVANVVSTPNYTVDPVRTIPGRLITGEITGMPLIRTITPEPTRRETFGEHVNDEFDYTRDDYKYDLFAAHPDEYTTPWANEYTDGMGFSGDINTHDDSLKFSQSLDVSMVPVKILRNPVKTPGALLRFWVGYVYRANTAGGRSEFGIADAIAKLFNVNPLTVYRNAEYCDRCMVARKIVGAKNIRMPDVPFTDATVSGEWGLKWNTAPRKPWETLDGERSYAEWGFDGPMDRADAQRRAMLNNI